MDTTEKPTITSDNLVEPQPQTHKCYYCNAIGDELSIQEHIEKSHPEKIENCAACTPSPNKYINVTPQNKCVNCGKYLGAQAPKDVNFVVEAQQQIVHTPVTETTKQESIRDAQGKFKPGVSGNPKGRPKRDWTWKEVLEDVAAEYVKKRDGTISKRTYRDMLAKRLFTLGIGGNVQAINSVMDRMDGKPKQSVELGEAGRSDLSQYLENADAKD